MSYLVRPMDWGDIPQVIAIDREAFPTTWPATSFKKEMHNKLARYLVAQQEGQLALPATGGDGSGRGSPWERLMGGVRRLFVEEPPIIPTPNLIVGFVGLWFMVDEAHITSIAVRQSHQRRGLGELLLIAAIDLAVMRNAQFMALEVRVSNEGAQALYRKYNFKDAGLRRSYYSDNGEDARIMTTDVITAATFQARFQALKKAYQEHWQRPLPLLTA